MSTKKGLGKGLSALIPELEVGPSDRPTEVAVTAIEPNPGQPRREMDTRALEELSQSMREHGVLQPLLVRRQGAGYQIVAGERRWRAAQRAGIERVPVVVREIDDRRVLEIALVENLQREDLNPLDEALAFQGLAELEPSQERVAEKVGKSRPYVTNALRLLQLEKEAQALVRDGSLSAGHARTLLPLSGPLQSSLAKEVVAEGLTVRQTERLVKQRMAGRKAKPTRSHTFSHWEDRLSRRLGAKAQILGTERKGKIVINYSGSGDLSRILEALGTTDSTG